MCDYLSAKGRPSSAASRAVGTERLAPTVTSEKQQNGSVSVGRQTAGGLSDSMGGFHGAVLYILGEKSQMKVLYFYCLQHLIITLVIMML